MVCNADRALIRHIMDLTACCCWEGDPHNIIEGMMLGGYAIGAASYVYVRAAGIPSP